MVRDDVQALLRRALQRRVLSEAPPPRASYFFRHALIRRAVADQLLAAERTDLHARIAERLVARFGAPATVAHHYELAGDAPRAREFYARAGDEAHAALAFADATDAYRRALQGPVDAAALVTGSKFLEVADLSVRRPEDVAILERLQAYAASSGRRAEAARL